MRQQRCGIVLALLLLSASPLAAQNADIEDALKPSVVCIRNDECFGSGFFLDAGGLILTNAHVACSPLPYRVHASAKVGGRVTDVIFKKVTLLGFHPDYDLALMRIDPAECDATIKPVALAAAPPGSGERVWAMGFPADYDRGNVKVTTWGEMRSSAYEFSGLKYLYLDISTTQGNSGGPACNSKGEVIGVITMSIKEKILAVPISAYKPDRFGPLRDRNPNREISNEFLERAERLYPPGSRGTPNNLAMLYFEMALIWDAGNASLYSKVGQLNLLCGRNEAAVAYLIRALRMDPWSEPSAYRTLGIVLATMKKGDEAIAIWDEGLHKYPADNGQLWGEFAVILDKAGHPFHAAVAARIALKTFVSNSAPVNQAYKNSVEKLNSDEMNKLRAIEADVDAHLADLRSKADKARRDGKNYLKPEAEKVIASYAGIQQEAAGGKGIPSSGPKALNVSDEELAIRFIRNRIEVAKEHVRSGRNDKAIDILEDVILSYPKHPETDSARLLLRFLKK